MDADRAASTTKKQCLPVPNATVPYWRTDLHWIDEYRSTEDLPTECDVAIIGAGLSGVSTAYHLSKLENAESRSIVMLEARQVCSGATGRNGGHVKMKSSSMQEFIDRHGVEVAEEMGAFVSEQIYALKHVVEKEKLDCEFELRRTFDVYLDTKEAETARANFMKSLEAGQKWTREADLIEGPNVEQITSLKGAKLAISKQACSLWPYKFVTQLLARLLTTIPLNLQTNTPATLITRCPTTHLNLIHTPRGTLRAKQLVFATNAYTKGISPTYKNTIVPTRITASHISPKWPVAPHLSHTYNIHYPPGPREERVDYLNPRPNGSIVVGGARWTYAHLRSEWYDNWDDAHLLPHTRPHFEGLMQRHFRGWEGSEAVVDGLWTGVTGTTGDGLPHVGKVPGEGEEGRYVLAGYNGGGMAFIFLVARGVAAMVGGRTFGETGLPGVFETKEERFGGK